MQHLFEHLMFEFWYYFEFRISSWPESFFCYPVPSPSSPEEAAGEDG
jgi:hypothetical protein